MIELFKSFSLRKEIVLNVCLKGLTMVVNFLTIPLTIEYLEPSRYGITITFSSILGLSTMMDFGLGENLRLGLNTPNQERGKLKSLVSTTYSYLVLIGVIIFLLVLLVELLIGWGKLLNVDQEILKEIRLFIIIATSAYSIKFVLNLIHKIFIGSKIAVYSTGLELLVSIVTLIAIWLALHNLKTSLIEYSMLIGLGQVITIFIISVLYFGSTDRDIKPSLGKIELWNRGYFSSNVKYFLISLSTFIVFSTDNVLISQLFSPSDVAKYHVAFRLFGIVSTLFVTVRMPVYANYAERYYSSDSAWLRMTTRRIFVLWIVLVFMILFLLIFCQEIVALWLGDRLNISTDLCITVAVYYVIGTFKSIYGLFLSGIGKLKLLSLNAIFISVVNIPLSIFFATYLGMGLKGVMIGTIVSIIPEAILSPLQYHKIIKNKASGIWNK